MPKIFLANEMEKNGRASIIIYNIYYIILYIRPRRRLLIHV